MLQGILGMLKDHVNLLKQGQWMFTTWFREMNT